MGFNINTSAKQAILQQGIVPYEQQTPEQRREFKGRISSMILIELLGEMLRENYKYVSGSVPLNPTSKELKILRSKLNQMKKDMAEIVSKAKGFASLYKTLLIKKEESYDQFEAAGFYAADIIKNVHAIPMEKFELLNSITDAIAKGDINSISDEDHDAEMLKFANYCMKLTRGTDVFNVPKSKKAATKKDLENFRNLSK